MELIKGRPANEADRLDKEIRVYDLLDQLGMEYYRTYMQEPFLMQPTENTILSSYDAGR